MSEPSESKSIDRHFAEWESEVIGFGYGSGEAHTLLALQEFLSVIKDRPYDYRTLESAVTPAVAWLLISILCRNDIIEYGSSPRYGWLTKEGEALREFVINRSIDQLVKICTDDEQLDYCTPRFCNCGPTGYSQTKLCHNPFWREKSD